MRKLLIFLFILVSGSWAFVEVRVANHDRPIAGPKAEGREGDFLLCNDLVTFLVEQNAPSSGYNIYPGDVLDAGFTKKSDCSGGPDYLGEVFMGLMPQGSLISVRGINLKNFQARKEPGRVIVEAIGEDVGIPIVEEFLNSQTKPLSLSLRRQYILEEGKPYLTIRTIFQYKGTRPQKLAPGFTFLLGDGLRLYEEGVGFDTSRLLAPKTFRPFVAGVGRKIAYAWFSPQSDFKVDFSFGGIFLGFYRGKLLRPGKELTYDVRLYVLPPSVEAIREALGVAGKLTLSGSVTVLGKPQPLARVHITQADEHIAMAPTDAKGHFSFHLSPGKYRVTVALEDHPPAEQDVNLTESRTLKLELQPSAAISVVVTDEQNQPIPAMLTAEGKVAPLPPLFGEDRDMTYPLVAFLLPGENRVAIQPGNYRLTFSHGFEYEIYQQKVVLQSGQTLAAKVILNHSVDTTGYLSGDFHVHAMPSPDSNDFLEDKVRGLAAHGVEVPVATDHNKVTDYQPIIEKLKLTKYLTSIIGDELTTIKYGHYNVFPLKVRPHAPDLGAPQWWGLTPPQIFQRARALVGKKGIIQINHPRSSGGSGYFVSVGLDPKTAEPKYKEIYSSDFDAIEVFNGKRTGQLAQTFPDWFGFLNHGKKLTATGNSDSHHIFGIEAGYPRNYVYVGTDEPDKVKKADFIQAVKAQKVVVSGGPFIFFSANGKGLGEVAEAKDGKVTLRITIESPKWMPLTRLAIFQNGKEVKSIPITSSDKVIKFEGKVELPVKQDSYFLITAEGDESLAPVYPGAHPFSFTNPIYVDVDGNGHFDPPAGEKS